MPSIKVMCYYAFVVFMALFTLPQNLFGQDTMARPYVIRDQNVDRLIDAFKKQNFNQGMQGFRVQVFTASGNRSSLLTDRQKAEFDSNYPGISSYKTYMEPYYRLRVGDFRTRLDAYRFLITVSSKYDAAIIVPDRISPLY